MNNILDKMNNIRKLDLSSKEREDLLFIVGGWEAVAADQITKLRKSNKEVQKEYGDKVDWDKVMELVENDG